MHEHFYLTHRPDGTEHTYSLTLWYSHDDGLWCVQHSDYPSIVLRLTRKEWGNPAPEIQAQIDAWQRAVYPERVA